MIQKLWVFKIVNIKIVDILELIAGYLHDFEKNKVKYFLDMKKASVDDQPIPVYLSWHNVIFLRCGIRNAHRSTASIHRNQTTN